MILAGDVGGTKVDLALCEFENGQLLTVRRAQVSSQGISGLGADGEGIPGRMQAAGGEDLRRPASECQGRYATAVLKLTNLPWVLDAGSFRVDLKIEHVS